MTKYHIREDGLPGVCKAQAGNCPIGGDHYSDKMEAILAAEEKMREEGSFLISVKKHPVYHVGESGQVEECPFRDGYCEVKPFRRFNNLHSADQDVIVGAARAFREAVGESTPEAEEPVESPTPRRRKSFLTGEEIEDEPAETAHTQEARKLLGDYYDRYRKAGWSEDEIQYYKDTCGHSFPPGRSAVTENGKPYPPVVSRGC